MYVRTRSVRIFRADPTVDAFTRQGGLYWRHRDQPGQFKLKQSPASRLFNSNLGPLVMIVRDTNTVRVYTLTPDLRC